MEKINKYKIDDIKNYLFLTLFLIFIYFTSLYNYLLFHCMTEFFSITIGMGIFLIVWNSCNYMDNDYLLFLGIAYCFICGFDFIHTLAYKGMNIFIGYDANLPTQLWIIARYVESISLFIAQFIITRKINPGLTSLLFLIVFIFLISSVLFWNIFPDCFIKGKGLTEFKIYSEYIICFILLITIIKICSIRKKISQSVFSYIILSLFFTIRAELVFTFYISTYVLSNLVGHFFKIISYFFIYKAIIETALIKPYNLLFRNLKINEAALEKEKASLEEKVKLRTKELSDINKKLVF